MSKYYNVGDKITPKKELPWGQYLIGKVYEVVIDFDDNSPSIIDEQGIYLFAHKKYFDLVEAAQVTDESLKNGMNFIHTTDTSGPFTVTQPEISVTRSESFSVAVQGQTLTLTREEAQKLSDKLLEALELKVEVLKGDVKEGFKVKEESFLKVGDNYPELPAEITEFRNEFGDFLQKEGVLAEYVENSRMGYNIPIEKSQHYINCAFTWWKTKQGNDFWDNLFDKWDDKLEELRNG